MGPNNNHNKKSFNRLSPWFVQQQRMRESNLNGPKAGFFFLLSHSLVPYLIPPLHCVVRQFVIRLHREESGQKWRQWFVTVGACANQRADRAPPEQSLFRNFFSPSNKFLSLFITPVTKALKKASKDLLSKRRQKYKRQKR